MVRLAAGLGPRTAGIDKDVAARALACLERFGQRLRDMHARQRARGGYQRAAHLAHRKQAFLERAREALGHPIEIIAGMEEARLIYLGRGTHACRAEPGRRLVVDIGGGSTEAHHRRGPHEPKLELESLQIWAAYRLERAILPPTSKISAQALRARAPGGARWSSSRCRRPSCRRGWDSLHRQLRHVCAPSADAIRALSPQVTVDHRLRDSNRCWIELIAWMPAIARVSCSLEPTHRGSSARCSPADVAILAEVFSRARHQGACA